MNKPNNKYEMLFNDCYDLVKGALLRHIKSGSSFLDIGINNANMEKCLEDEGIECSVFGIDTDAAALAEIGNAEWSHVSIQAEHIDADEIVANHSIRYDLVLVSSTLHEINDWKFQLDYLCWFFNFAVRCLKTGGKLVIGDFYYPRTVKRADVEKFMEFQLAEISHADRREKFVRPSLIVEVARRYGFKVVEREEIRAVRELDRRYYVIVLEKV